MNIFYHRCNTLRNRLSAAFMAFWRRISADFKAIPSNATSNRPVLLGELIAAFEQMSRWIGDTFSIRRSDGDVS